MGWLIALGIITLLAVIPLGVYVSYDSAGALVRIIAGPVKITVFPRTKKEKKEKPKNKSEKENNGAAQTMPEKKQGQPAMQAKKEKSKASNGGSLLDFIPLVKLAFRFLGDFRRKLRINHLYLRLIMAADDPCDLAVNYGRAWGTLGNLLPRLERYFVIKKRDIEVECDFTASETLVRAQLDLTITLGRLVALVVLYAIRGIVDFLKIMKKRKGGAQNESKTS